MMPMHKLVVCVLAIYAVAADADTAQKTEARFSKLPVPDQLDRIAEEARYGHDFFALAKASERLPKRGEFEDSDAYEKRLQAALERPVYGAVSLRSRLMLVGGRVRNKDNAPDDAVYYAYDADAKSFKVCLSGFAGSHGYPQIPDFSEFSVPIRIAADTKRQGNYIGTNAFGARANVSKARYTTFQLLIGGYSPMQHPCTASMIIDAQTAKDISTTTVWAVIGHLQSTLFFETRDYVSPTVHSPAEVDIRYINGLFGLEMIVLFNPTTGEIRLSSTL